MSPAHMARAPRDAGRRSDETPSRMLVATTVLKYVLALGVLALGARVTHDWHRLAAGALELVAIHLASNAVARRNVVLGNVVSDTLMLVFFMQCGVLVFAADYVTPIMLSNLFNL